MADSRYYLQVLSLIYLVLVTIVYLIKKIKPSIGSRVFSQLIMYSFLTCLFDIAAIYTQGTQYKLLHYYLNRFFVAAIVGFVLMFTEYITIILSEATTDEEKLDLYDNIHFKASILYIVWCMLFIYITSFYSYQEQELGNIVTVLYCAFSWVLCIGYWIMVMCKYLLVIIGDEFNFFKIVYILIHTFFKNLIPIAIAIVPGTIGILFQFMFPQFHVITPIFAFTVVNMYFTFFPIENPDLAIVEEMENAKLEAEHANQSKNEFLSNVSHEIRTPLNAILGFSQTLLEENISPNVREEVEYIINSSDTLLDIVNEILDISKIASHKLEIVNVDYSIDKVYKTIVTKVQNRLGSNQLQFIYNCDENIPKVLNGDYVRIQQIAMNLLNNAIKYTESGFIKLKIECDNIGFDTCRLIITVTDSGIGISQENIEKIFSKFEGLEMQKDVEVEGTGLGLSLTKKLVNMMDGKIVVQSVRGEGSTFKVYLPQIISSKSLAELEAESPKEQNKKFIGNGERILIVDDNAVNLKVALRLMKPYNLNIETLTSGKACIEKIQQGETYDLVMLDDMMPDISGVETLEYLKRMGAYNMVTVALTANATSGIREEYLSQGFDDYLAKPINKNLLEELFIKHLGNKRRTVAINNGDIYSENNQTNNSQVKEPEIVTQQIEPIKEEIKKDATVGLDSNTKGNKDFLVQNGIDLDKAMELLGDMEMYDETVSDFLEEIDQKLADIEKYHANQDMPNYAIQVHSLKSDSKYLGIMDLADIAYKHEMASKGNDVDFVNSNYDELMTLAKQKVEIIRKYNGN